MKRKSTRNTKTIKFCFTLRRLKYEASKNRYSEHLLSPDGVIHFQVGSLINWASTAMGRVLFTTTINLLLSRWLHYLLVLFS